MSTPVRTPVCKVKAQGPRVLFAVMQELCENVSPCLPRSFRARSTRCLTASSCALAVREQIVVGEPLSQTVAVRRIPDHHQWG